MELVPESNRTTSATHGSRPLDYEFVIIGAGFGGIGVAIQLNRMGIDDICIIDRASDLGGTWHLNTYPGLAVDIPSTTYSYSFEPNPRWSRLFAPGAELKDYAVRVAKKYNLRRYMRFNTAVERVVYDSWSRSWTVYTDSGDSICGRILIMATGFLSQPKFPNIPGLDGFQGKVIHTSMWDHDYELAGKRAAVIGTGATSVQLLPEIAPTLKKLDVYQRTPIWVMPKVDGDIPPVVRKLFARLPLTQRMARITTNSILELAMVTAALNYRRFPGLSVGAGDRCKEHLRRQIPDRELREKLTPNYSFGCKRPTTSNTYYPTFLRDNVELVTDGIDRIEEDGIVANGGIKREIDTLILATGYKVWEKGNFPAFDVVGADGTELGTWWDQNQYESYEGISVHGYPNMFYLASPYGFTGLSYFFTIEGQMMHIKRVIRAMKRHKATSFEVKRSAQDTFVTKMKKNMKGSVFKVGDCGPANTYYLNQHGEPTLLRPTPTLVALWQSSHFPLQDYTFMG